MKNMRIRISLFVVLIIIVIIGYFYINQSHRNIENEKAVYEISSGEITSSFLDNLNQAEAKFLNLTVEISGNITELSFNSVTLDNNVFCQFDNALENELDINSKVKIKGRVIGYDDLLEQVKMDQCTINNEEY